MLWDGSGETYWSYPAIREPMQIVKVADLDGDGTQEILIREGATVVARRSLPGILWKTAALGDVWSVVPDPLGNLLVQTEEGIQTLDHTGRLRTAVSVPGGAILKGRIASGNGQTLDVFGPRYYADVDAEHDLDGDGRKDILVSSPGAIQVFSQEGKILLSLRITNNQIGPIPVLENLDGRPGDEPQEAKSRGTSCIVEDAEGKHGEQLQPERRDERIPGPQLAQPILKAAQQAACGTGQGGACQRVAGCCADDRPKPHVRASLHDAEQCARPIGER